MVTYEEFKQMLIDRLSDPKHTETSFFTNRLIAYADELVDIVLNPPQNPPTNPPILPDIEPDPKPL